MTTVAGSVPTFFPMPVHALTGGPVPSVLASEPAWTVPSVKASNGDSHHMPAAIVMASAESSNNSVAEISVLTSLDASVNKRFYLNADGKVEKENYRNAFLFNVVVHRVNGIDGFAKFIEEISRDSQKLLVRGLPKGRTERVQRLKENFIEPFTGVRWVMLDFDGVVLAEGMDPTSQAAIEYLISRLPAEFRNASYYYQFSASSGILEADGTPKKPGISVHIFFFLAHPVPSKPMSAYISQYCMDSGFYEFRKNRGGVAELLLGVDPAPIRSFVQPHFIAAPTIEAGVTCMLDATKRQGLVRKDADVVAVPELGDSVIAVMQQTKKRLVTEYKRANGYVTRKLYTQVAGGIAVTRYSVAPSSQSAAVRGGRPFVGSEISTDDRFLTLYFGDEGSPGSWFVVKDLPQLAFRHGDSASLPLKELSIGAHEYVRDQLKWFAEVPHIDLELVNGFLPAFSGFAHAKVSLILSPTGTGKTRAAIVWTQEQIAHQRLVVYTAPTIVLVKQMRDDLASAGLTPIYYDDVWSYTSLPRSGVIVITNKSLPKLLERIYDQGIRHVLVVDEIHQALDGFHKSNRNLAVFEGALSRSQQSLLLTGTLTDVQSMAIVEIAKRACGGLTIESYCCYEFLPVKRNPIHILPLSRFDSDLVLLLETLQAMRCAGKVLPRVVLLMDTSRMEQFRILLERFGLDDLALVVSRQECTPEEVEAARVSILPIFVASPLFALGLNSVVQPNIFYCRFRNIDVDTSHIVQTVNRANRGDVVAEVRIYGNVDPDASFRVQNWDKVKVTVSDRVRQEASLTGLLEEHHHLDRVTYEVLREAERDSGTALSVLVQSDEIQNFTVVPLEGLMGVDKEKAKVAKDARGLARQTADETIRELAAQSRVQDTFSGILALEKLQADRDQQRNTESTKTERELEQARIAILLGMCGMSEVTAAAKVNARKLLRLLGERSPWISDQYERSTFPNWAKVEAEKTDRIILVVEMLCALRSGERSVDKVLASLTRNKQLKEGFNALVDSDIEYQRNCHKFEGLAEKRAGLREKGGDDARAKVRTAGLTLLMELLQPIGVAYGMHKVNGRNATNPELPIVPAQWDFDQILLQLRRQAARLRALPDWQVVPMVESEPQELGAVPMKLEVCLGCVYYYQSKCAIGRPVDFFYECYQAPNKCPESCQLPAGLELY